MTKYAINQEAYDLGLPVKYVRNFYHPTNRIPYDPKIHPIKKINKVTA